MLGFFVIFWLTILILLFFAILYSIFAFQAIEDTSMFEEDAELVSARDFIFWALIAFVIAWLITFGYGCYGIVDGVERLFDRWLFNGIAYITIFIFILVGSILSAYALSRTASTISTLNNPSAQEAENNINIVLISSVAAGLLILGGYLGYLYQLENTQDLLASCNQDPPTHSPSCDAPHNFNIF